MRRFEGTVVVVTGASRGIGRSIAERFASEGAKVACVATSAANAEPTAQATGGKAYGLDVSDTAAVEAVFAQIEADFGKIDVLVNNAGLTRDTLALRMKEDDWDRVIDVNLKGTFNCCKAVLKGMMKARRGRIVNISSVVGLHGAAGQVNYSASKAGIVGLTMSLAKELGSRGVTVNAVAPGFIDTDMTAELSDEMREGVVKNAPLGRLGEGSDIAGVVAFLASDDAGYLTGQVLTVDGGLTL
ncbi:MAG: 3-oxoacyl-[acyl-carrier-protein] reductase [Fimbriimonadaceae bacterium]|nr:3-oxoacyl-[acyl-carrier-protein] reductase [Fimbriimonadaceae bacterium]